MRLYALQFVACKVSVDGFSLLYSKLLHAKLSLFVFGANFAESHWQVIMISSCFIRELCLSVAKLAWLSGQCLRLKIP